MEINAVIFLVLAQGKRSSTIGRRGILFLSMCIFYSKTKQTFPITCSSPGHSGRHVDPHRHHGVRVRHHVHCQRKLNPRFLIEVDTGGAQSLQQLVSIRVRKVQGEAANLERSRFGSAEMLDFQVHLVRGGDSGELGQMVGSDISTLSKTPSRCFEPRQKFSEEGTSLEVHSGALVFP